MVSIHENEIYYHHFLAAAIAAAIAHLSREMSPRTASIAATVSDPSRIDLYSRNGRDSPLAIPAMRRCSTALGVSVYFRRAGFPGNLSGADLF
jgi:hypothetical protein